jgi:hypothetical protein
MPRVEARPLPDRRSISMTIAAAVTVVAVACGGASPRAQDAPAQPRATGAGASDAGGGARALTAASPGARPIVAATAAGARANQTAPSAAASGTTPTPDAPADAPARATSGSASSSGGEHDGASTQTSAATAGDVSGAAVATQGISIPGNETVVPLPTPAPSATPLPAGGAMIGGCPVFPADNPWNQDISQAAVDPESATYISNIGGGNLHADFGGGGAYGIPYIVVPKSQPMVPINFTAYGSESDPGPYPVPLTAPVEGGAGSTGDRHVLAVQQGPCMLYEMYRAFPTASGWNADSGAVFDLRSNALRPDTWTPADAAGLPITAGLVRYDEIAAGRIDHAVRFTVNTVRKAWVHPATHYGTSTSATRIPYGGKLRLRASYDISGFHGQRASSSKR